MNQTQALLEKARNDKELMETELEDAAGGATQNRYDPQRCGNTTRTSYECVGFLTMTWCDHYRQKYIPPAGIGPGGPVGAGSGERYRHVCVMGRYDYEGDMAGKPVE